MTCQDVPFGCRRGPGIWCRLEEGHEGVHENGVHYTDTPWWGDNERIEHSLRTVLRLIREAGGKRYVSDDKGVPARCRRSKPRKQEYALINVEKWAKLAEQYLEELVKRREGTA